MTFSPQIGVGCDKTQRFERPVDGNNCPINDAIGQGRHELLSMLQHYGPGRQDLILMLRSLSQQDMDEHLMREIDAENKTALHDLLMEFLPLPVIGNLNIFGTGN